MFQNIYLMKSSLQDIANSIVNWSVDNKFQFNPIKYNKKIKRTNIQRLLKKQRFNSWFIDQPIPEVERPCIDKTTTKSNEAIVSVETT